MINIERTILLTTAILLFSLSACQHDRSSFMNDEQQQDLQATYESMQDHYMDLIDRYETIPDSGSGELQYMYTHMQQMHQQMDVNHRQMMGMDMDRHGMQGDQMMQSNQMMSEGMGMRMQGHMTGEWYQQMRTMHERIAVFHEQQGQHQMAEMNNQLSQEYENMMHLVPGLDELTGNSFNAEGDPGILNGENLFDQNCASCHGSDGNGFGNAFPPLVNSVWITEDKSIPIRILMHGLTGDIEVKGRSYSGTMPSFRARLSAAEIAAILNHLRSISNVDTNEITQEDVIQVGETYSDRSRPWTPEELKVN